MLKKYWWVLPLALFTAFGFILRIHLLDWQCFATDEIVTFKVAGWDTATIIFWALGGDYNPPLYYLLAHWSSVFFGSVSSFSIRFPSVILGTLCIPAGYLLGTEFKNKTVGLLMAATTSFLYPLIYYSQNARFYMLIMLFFMGYILCFVKIYRGDTRNKILVAGSVLAALCLWSHFYSIIPLTISLCILLAKYRKLSFLGMLTVFLLCLPFTRYIETVTNHFINISKVIHNQWWLGPGEIAMLIPAELFCWTWTVIIPLAAFTLYKYRDSLHLSLIVIALATALSCLPMTAITAMSPRYTLLISPIVLIVAFYPLAEYIDNQETAAKKSAVFIGIVFLLFLFNVGSIISWFSFNICPLVNLSLSARM